MELLDTTEVVEKNARLLGLSLSNLDCERENEDGNYVQLTLELK